MHKTKHVVHSYLKKKVFDHNILLQRKKAAQGAAFPKRYILYLMLKLITYSSGKTCSRKTSFIELMLIDKISMKRKR